MSPLAERCGDTVRLTVNAEQSDSPVIELSVAELRNLLTGAERDLADYFALAADWPPATCLATALPSHPPSPAVVDLPAPAIPPEA
ncbi:hypothetical protein RB628_29725 [Streptomyces sp. ADMS]|uniref:hypothetical protein n=1 Tax=Streptomyces sp. ADMS TaxID=3071415 RepID=UPI00296FFF4C|nr:hypothetical protein [Streptomyces sp. ADMS]MDW4909408.1 hypothetical protein [Streptomyces sp. ADMS]